ncbi:MAG: hypothetical protein JST86_09885 [Bacteroidetes bacterium]|nr:hypothetical protein [Bacteroidota bacterium]
MSDQVTGGYPDTIPLSTGVDYTTNWRNYISGLDPNPGYIRAFNIPMADIQSLASFTKCPSVRAYLGLAVAGDISTLKLVLVPVDASGNDVTSMPGLGAPTDSTVFDFTTSCPQACDVNSPLF